MRAKRSRPTSSVPRKCRWEGGALGASRNCRAYPAGAIQFAASDTAHTASTTTQASLRVVFIAHSRLLAPQHVNHYIGGRVGQQGYKRNQHGQIHEQRQVSRKRRLPCELTDAG